MSAKAKYEKIDKSKLNDSLKKLLSVMKEKTDNFENEEVVKKTKVEEALDKLIKKYPDAVKKPSKSRTKKSSKAKKSSAKRETVMTVAKRIRKKDESWQDAMKRAKLEMGKSNTKVKKQVDTELEKLKKMIKEDAVLKGFSNSQLQRDAVRKAKPRGKRKSTTKGETTNQYGTFKNKVGRPYWESRENRSDRYAPKYPANKPFLEDGGVIVGGSTVLRNNADIMDLGIANSDAVFKHGGAIHEMRKEKDIDIYDEQMAKGGKIGNDSNTKGAKKYEIFEYLTQSARTPDNEYTINVNDFDKLIEKITKRALDKKIPHIEVEYGGSYLGSINERRNYRFQIGNGFLDNPLQSKMSYINNQVNPKYRMAKGGQLKGFTNDPIYTEGDISVQRVGGSTMWNVAYKGKPKGRVLDAFTKEQAVRKFEKTKDDYFAKGGKTQGKIYIIQEKSKYDRGVPKWKDEKFLTGGKKYLSYKDAQDDKKKLQRMSSSIQYKVVEWMPKLGFAKGGKTQGYNDKLDESLGMREGREDEMMQSYKDRRNESKGMEKAMGRRAYQSVSTMDEMGMGGYLLAGGTGAYLGAKYPNKVKKVTDPLDKAVEDINRNLKNRYENGGLVVGGSTVVRNNGDIMPLGTANADAVFQTGGVTAQTVVNPNEAMADLQSTYGFDDVYAKGGQLKDWEKSMKKRKDIEYLRIEKTQALPNGKTMIYYKYNPVGSEEFKGTQVGTDSIYAKGGVAEGYSKFRVVFYNYSGETEEKEFDNYSDAYDYYNGAVDDEVGGGTTTIMLQGYSDKYDEFEDIFYFDPMEMSEEDEDFAKGGVLSFKSTKEADKYLQSLSDKEFKKLGDFALVYNGKEYIVKKDFKPVGYAKGGEIIEYSKVYEILESKIEDAVADLYSTYENSEQAEGKEVEYKSRDGFIPFTNGGYSSRWFEYSNMLEGSGISLPTKSLEDKIEEFRENSREYALERFEEEYPEIVEELGGIDNVNYNSLDEAGYSSEADELDEFERDDDDSIMMEVEAYYYNPNNDRGEDGKHTIQLSGVVNLEAPYHRSGNLEDYIEERFTFNSYKELEDKLDKGLAKVVSWFEGDMYDKNPRELKIRRMAKGGKIGFEALSKKVAKRYVGKKVPEKFQNEYGKTYSPAEAKEVGDKVAGAVYRMQQAKKMAKGGDIESYDEFIAREDEYLDNAFNRGSDEYKIHNKVQQLMKKDNKWHPDYRGYVDETYYEYYKKAKGFAKGGEVSVYGTNGNYYLKKYGRTYSSPSYKTKKEAENWARLINKGEYKLSNQGLEYVEEKNRLAKGGKTQGYNDKLDESLGNTKGKRSTKEQNYKDRRNESEAMEKKGGRRKYARVKTMDKGSRKLKKPNSFFAVVKRKQKKGEAWKDAIQRVKNEMKK